MNPQGFVSPMTWGIESNVVERFGKAGVAQDNVSFLRDSYRFNYAGAPAELVEMFERYYRPTMNAFEAAEKEGRAAQLRTALNALFESRNVSTRKDVTSIPATFLRVSVSVNQASPRVFPATADTT